MSKVTIAIPTYNRASFLRQSLRSALDQNFEDLTVLVLDNASNDDTAGVARSFRDPRVIYCRCDRNIGMVANFNRAIRLNRSEYLTLLLDDDLLLPDFASSCAAALDCYPSAGFVLACAGLVTPDGGPAGTSPDSAALRLGHGPTLLPGADYLELNAGTRVGGNPSTVMFRATALAAAGEFDSPHTKHTTELNLYIRLAERFDVALAGQELVHVRLHPEQASNREWSDARIGYVAEYIDALARLIGSDRADDAAYRRFLRDRLLSLNARQSEVVSDRVPHLNWDWDQRLEMALSDLCCSIPPGATYVLVDESQFGPVADLPGRRRTAYIDRDGEDWGAPVSDEQANVELDRLLECGVTHIAIAWPAVWWFDQYPSWAARLDRDFTCVLRNSRLRIYEVGARA